ncbi:MOSC domain-containing protein [Candidatus Spongiihabitans sp.]|uniref:MOSC domain-containing protein n=1 Tax=Candidatus Spongiihabitans sp. TaxID=3101308 RepID=UPI003C6F48B9
MHISEIHVYPVKSLGGISLQSARLTLAGFQFDRQWMVVQADGTFMTQRSFPQMALIETEIVDDVLVLSTFGMEAHVVKPVGDNAERINTEVWGDQISALEYHPITNEWLSQALDSPCKLVSFPADQIRQCDRKFANSGEHTKFADGFPLLLLSQESLDDLNQRLQAPVGMDRFRPNIVVKGCDAFAEDHWHTIRVNNNSSHNDSSNINLRIVKPCARCSVPTVNQQTGVLAGPEPIHTLSSYRQRGGKVYFGMNSIPDGEGSVSIGDRVSIVN